MIGPRGRGSARKPQAENPRNPARPADTVVEPPTRRDGRADGLHVEVHSCPEKALSDGPQALLPAQYDQLMDEIRQLAELLGRTIDATEGVAA